MLLYRFVNHLSGLVVKHRAAMSIVDGLRKPGCGDHGATGVVVDRRTRHQSVKVFWKSLSFQQNRLSTLRVAGHIGVLDWPALVMRGESFWEVGQMSDLPTNRQSDRFRVAADTASETAITS